MGHTPHPDYVLDLQALSYARERAIASRMVLEESLDRAVMALHSGGISVREIARLTGIPKTGVARLLDRLDHVDAPYLVDRAEYIAAHNAAWRHVPSRQI